MVAVLSEPRSLPSRCRFPARAWDVLTAVVGRLRSFIRASAVSRSSLGQVAVMRPELVGDPLPVASTGEQVGIGLHVIARVGEHQVVLAAQMLEQVLGYLCRIPRSPSPRQVLRGRPARRFPPGGVIPVAGWPRTRVAAASTPGRPTSTRLSGPAPSRSDGEMRWPASCRRGLPTARYGAVVSGPPARHGSSATATGLPVGWPGRSGARRSRCSATRRTASARGRPG